MGKINIVNNNIVINSYYVYPGGPVITTSTTTTPGGTTTSTTTIAGTTTTTTSTSTTSTTTVAGTTTSTTTAFPDNNVNAPIVYRLYSNTAGDKIRIETSKPITNPVGKHSSFAVTGKTVTAAGLLDANTIELTINSAFTQSDDIFVSYTRGLVQATDTGYLQTFGPAPVQNTMTTSTLPFFDKWTFLIDATNSSSIEVSGSDIIKIWDSTNIERYFLFQTIASVGKYATYGTNIINVINSVTAEYLGTSEYSRNISGKFTLFCKLKTPNSGDTGATSSAFLMRHSNGLSAIQCTWNPTAARRNIRPFTTQDYWLSTTAQTSIANNNALHYFVATYNGTTLKAWSNNDAFVQRTPTMVSAAGSDNFDRIFQSNGSTRAGHGLVVLGLGDYIPDSDVPTLLTALSTY